MISAFDDVEKVRAFHFEPDLLQKFQRTKGIAGALDKKNRRSQLAQNLIAQPGRIAPAAQRIAETNQAGDRFFERDMASNPSAHAFADQECRPANVLPGSNESLPVGGDQ